MIKSLFLLAAIDLSLRTLGFARTRALIRRLTHGAGSRSDAALATEICRRITMAAVFYPGRARCLEQSLALYLVLRRRALAAELRLGVQPYPFVAHAWVEVGGIPINERPEVIGQFVPMEGFAV